MKNKAYDLSSYSFSSDEQILVYNIRWLRERIDEIHDALCPEKKVTGKKKPDKQLMRRAN